ncbi:molybdopterin-dependent oxidoreductase [Nocardia sp. 2]|uniref:Molybdopterin-dependent oxidoreductase n=1 Tax=Nocardia acididurans TaxID=2802282 RepID=A0ABS1LYX2_9NOCA|nr:molybdopterin-dependent oxidoreductase [Nocardia acididurans]MBL1073617.1 molybdopterin-dependent oxidoreductase [Nocardia acididurans]
MTLPPGQRALDNFPRFGTHLHHPPPPIPDHPTIEITGPLPTPLTLTTADLAQLPRREQDADFHCVAGWSATGLRWAGTPFEPLYRTLVAPLLDPTAPITHISFTGLDGYYSIAHLDDALAADVLIADHLDGHPLTPDHGAPLRLVSPSQYGYISTKHLSRITFHTTEPPVPDRWSPIAGHPRARVWHEERNRYLSGRLVRPLYHRLIEPIRKLSAKGSTTA